MIRYIVPFVVFLAGLAVVGWIGAGYVGSNPLALTVATLIGAFYLAGAIELQRYQQRTAALARAVAGLADTPPSLAAWLDQLPPGLRNTARLRIEGERAAFPGPSLTPYLVGLLVLLGMLGTFLGMVATLRGTGMALESAIDLHAIRESLAAPVKGLGFAFGTSVAGVATSAALGLLAALARRERIHAVQQLDTKVATTLRVYSPAYQREQAFELLQRQSDAMPVLAERLQAMMATIEQQSQALNERLAAGQDTFHDKADAAYTRLAAAMEQALKQGVADSAAAAGAAIRPAVEATLAGLARETSAWQDTLAQTVRQQLDGLSGRFEATTSTVADTWTSALAEHQRASEALAQGLGASLQQFTRTFEERSAGLLDSVSARLDATTAGMAAAWSGALAQQEEAGARLAGEHQRALAAATATLEQHSAALLSNISQSHADLQAELAARDEQRLAAWHASLTQTAQDLSAQTQSHARDTIAEVAQLVQTAAEAPKAAAAVIAELRQKLSDSMARDNAMLDERSRLMETLGTLLDAVNHASSQQRIAVDELIATSAGLLERVGSQFTDQVERAGSQFTDKIDRASTQFTEQAARASAQLTEQAERASAQFTEQAAQASTQFTEQVDRLGAQFTSKVEAETGKLDGMAAQVAVGAAEVASLGEAFSAAVQAFGQSSDKLVDHLQRIEAALDKSMARSDEQLAYYVAQAREVIDLSVMSQKQILEDLQQLAGQPAAAGSETA